MSTETSSTAAGTQTEFGIDILEPTKEILRCYDEKINSKDSWYGEIPGVQNKLRLEHIAVLTEEDVLARVGRRISDEFWKRIEWVDTVDRLDRRVCELEKENEVLRYERDTQASDLRVVCREVDTFLDVVESFLDADYDREKAPGLDDMGRRASSSSVSKSPIMLTIKSRPGPDHRSESSKGKRLCATHGSRRSASPVPRKSNPGEKDKEKRPGSPGIRSPSPSPSPRSKKMSVNIVDKGKRAVSPGIRTSSISPRNGSITNFSKDRGIHPLSPCNRYASPSPKKAYLNIADTRKRKWPESERQAQEVTQGKVVLPPGRWKV